MAKRPVRTSLTVLGIVLSISLTITMFSISEGVRWSSQKIIYEGGIDVYVLAEGANPIFGGAYFENGAEIANNIKDDRMRHVFPVLYYDMYVGKSTNASYENMTDFKAVGLIPSMMGDFKGLDVPAMVNLDGSSFGIKEDAFRADENYTLGRYPDGYSSPLFTHEIVLNRVIAEEINAKIGDTVYVSITSDFRNSVEMKVVNITEPSFEFPDVKYAYIHISELQYIAHLRHDAVSKIIIDLYNPLQSDDVKRDIKEKYKLSAYTQDDFINEINKFTLVFEGFAQMIIAVAYIISLLFITTIMVLSVRESAGEISALRAMGISRRTIFLYILQESYAMCLLGLLLGIPVGFGMAEGLNSFIKSLGIGVPESARVTVLTPMVLINSAVMLASVGAIAGLIPAIWVTRKNITEVLRKEGL